MGWRKARHGKHLLKRRQLATDTWRWPQLVVFVLTVLTGAMVVSAAGAKDHEDHNGNGELAMQVTKDANPLSRPEPGGDFTYTVEVTNTGEDPFFITEVEDDVYGDVCEDLEEELLSSEESTTCQFVESFTGQAGDSQTNTVTVTGCGRSLRPLNTRRINRCDEEDTVSDSDDATVTIVGRDGDDDGGADGDVTNRNRNSLENENESENTNRNANENEVESNNENELEGSFESDTSSQSTNDTQSTNQNTNTPRACVVCDIALADLLGDLYGGGF